jgi:hypothetical protein
MTTPERIALWDAVNEYAAACGGDTSNNTISDRRMDAVVAVDRAAGAAGLAESALPALLAEFLSRADPAQVDAALKAWGRAGAASWNRLAAAARAALIVLEDLAPELVEGGYADYFNREAGAGLRAIRALHAALPGESAGPDPEERDE